MDPIERSVCVTEAKSFLAFGALPNGCIYTGSKGEVGQCFVSCYVAMIVVKNDKVMKLKNTVC